jgi:hypothetical protein
MLKIKYDLRTVREKIVAHLQACPDASEQRRWIRRYFGHHEGFVLSYQDLIARRIIEERGTGKRGDPVIVSLLPQTGWQIL